MIRAYRTLLLLYPARHRERFAPEMQYVFEEAGEDCRRKGNLRYASFLLAEFAGLIGGAIAAWSGACGGSESVRRRCSLAVSLLAGGLVSIAIPGFFFAAIGSSLRAARAAGYSEADKFALLVMICLCCLLLAVLLIAFFWMTERSLRARTVWRHQGVYRHSRRAGRQLHRARL